MDAMDALVCLTVGCCIIDTARGGMAACGGVWRRGGMWRRVAASHAAMSVSESSAGGGPAGALRWLPWTCSLSGERSAAESSAPMFCR